MVESSGLLNRRRGLNLYRGFESPPLRQIPNSLPFPPKPLESQVVVRFESRNCSNGFRKHIRDAPAFQASCSKRWKRLRCSAPGCSVKRSAALLARAKKGRLPGALR